MSSGWLSGAARAGQEITARRSNVMPQRFDLDVPANRVKLDAVTGVDLAPDEKIDTRPSRARPRFAVLVSRLRLGVIRY